MIASGFQHLRTWWTWLRTRFRRRPSPAPERSVEPTVAVTADAASPAPPVEPVTNNTQSTAADAALADRLRWRYNLDAVAEMLDRGPGPDGEALSCEPPSTAIDPYEDLPRFDPSQVATAVESVANIPVLKSIAWSFQAASRSTICPLAEMADLVRRDLGLHAKVLKMANSAYLHSAQPILDIEHAMFMLGVDRVRFMAQSLSAFAELKQLADGFDLRHLWGHAFAAALLAERLGDIMGLQDLPHAYSAGLLHDIGKVLLASLYPEVYLNILRVTVVHSLNLRSVERHIFGLDHEEVGRSFAAAQNLPDPIADSIAHHSFPDTCPPDSLTTVCLVFLANHFSRRFGLGYSGNPTLEAPDDLERCITLLYPQATARADRQATLARMESLILQQLPEVRRELDELMLLTFGQNVPVLEMIPDTLDQAPLNPQNKDGFQPRP